MWRQLTALAMFALLAVSSPAQETKTEQGKAPEEQKVAPEVVGRNNPVASSPTSIAEGKRIFAVDCVMCHGKEGDGKGEVAVSMKLTPPDFRDDTAMKKFTDGELFNNITNGKGGMPPEGKRAAPDQIWNLVNYVRSISQKKSSPDTK
jgi:mono/diheme cytochrome c family protein